MGRVQIFTGDGYGKTMAALGEALIAAASGKRVVVIQFLKGRGLTDSTFERQLEPADKSKYLSHICLKTFLVCKSADI